MEITPESEEGIQILDILQKYFMKETGSKQKTEQLMAQLASAVQEPGAKLVHLGKTVFLVLVRGKGMVEVHTMSVDDDSLSLAKSFNQLVSFLKNIGVKLAYTYSDDPKYELIAKRTKLPFKKRRILASNGQEYTAYYLEFQ
jgi:hypothetical protein